jgi:hypothetical protein
MKDATDVVELLKAGVDASRCRAWLAANAPPLLARFETLVQRAEEESR